MKSHVKLIASLIAECGKQCGVRVDKDIETVLARSEKEGFSFLAITLPSFEKGLLRSLEEGFVSSTFFPGFSGKGGLPKLFSGFLRNIFSDDCEVRPLTYDVVTNIRCLRQVCLFYSKVEAPLNPERVRDAIDTYVKTDQGIPELGESLLTLFGFYSDHVLGSYFQDVENRLYADVVRFKHGPGATAEKLTQNKKWASCVWTDRLERVFPYYGTVCTGPRDFLENPPVYLDQESELPVRVITVPKTMKGPRVISIEPSWNMFVQQGILDLLTTTLEKPSHAPIRNVFDWTDQERNRRLQKDFGAFCTIDLSEASDRVSLALVDRMLRRFPLLREAVMASRSTRAELPDGRVISLRKFASMGSALCFPFEAMVFTIISLIGITAGSIASLRALGRLPEMSVFGDDIIVPKGSMPLVIESLESFALKVNVHKSFGNGLFRESCGSETYGGYDVSVVKCRALIPDSKLQSDLFIRAVDLHNRLFERGLFETADSLLLGITTKSKPLFTSIGSKRPGFWTYDDSKIRVRFNPHTHNFEHLTYKVRLVKPRDEISSYPALRKYFFRNLISDTSRIPGNDEHLLTAGRPLSAAIKTGWGDPLT